MNSSCWTCEYHQTGGVTLFGLCGWFLKKLQPAKEIPASVVDVGCKLYVEKAQTTTDGK